MFIVFMFTRFGGGDGNMIRVGDNDDVNAEAFAYMVVFGYLYIHIVQMIGILLGEEMNVQVYLNAARASGAIGYNMSFNTLMTMYSSYSS